MTAMRSFVRGYGRAATTGPRALGEAPTATSDPPAPADTSKPAPTPAPAWLFPTIFGGIFLLIGAAIYTQYKIASTIAEKEGSTGLLKYEGGKAAIGAAEYLLESPERLTMATTDHDIAEAARELVQAEHDWLASWGDNDRRIPAEARRREAKQRLWTLTTATMQPPPPAPPQDADGLRPG